MNNKKLRKIFSLLFLISFLTGFTNKTTPPVSENISFSFTAPMTEHLQELAPSEQEEQIRDWILLGCISYLKIDQDQLFESLYDFSSLRFEFMRNLSDYQFGESRSFSLKNGDLYTITPKDHPKRKVWIARETDKYRMIHGKFPQKVYTVDYRMSLEDMVSANFTIAEEINPQDIFSPQWGYYEARVNNQGQLTDFLKKIDDLTYVSSLGSGIKIGGRRFEAFRIPNIEITDLAAIYQADNNLEEEFKKKYTERGMHEEYENFIANGKLKILRNPSLYGFSIWDIRDLEDEIRKKYPYEWFLEERLKSFVENADLGVGFSLDPQLKHKDFARNLTRFINNDSQALKAWYDKFQREDDLRSLIFSYKASNSSSNKLFGDIFGDDDTEVVRDTIESAENSLYSLLHGTKKEIKIRDLGSLEIDSLIKNYEIPRENLEREIASIFKGTQTAILNKKNILSIIAKRAKVNDMVPLYQYLAYLNQRSVITIDPESKKPGYNYLGASNKFDLDAYIVQDVIDMLYESHYLDEKIANQYHAAFSKAVKAFKADYQIQPVNAFIDLSFYQLLLSISDDKRSELADLRTFLYSLKKSQTYQKARYDGDLQGTEVGMNLFYTDLVMKLWSFNFQKSAPEDQVEGFYSNASLPLSFTYFDDLKNHSSTRSWLGPLDQGFNFNGNNTSLYFDHIATRIFNASPNDLTPGIEAEANYASEKFAYWWNKNYSKVADYEPEYHKLNQLMKWTQVISWLKPKGELEFLNKNNIKVSDNKHFKDWYQKREDLTAKYAIDSILFLNEKQLNERTECIEVVTSDPYYQFKDMVYTMSGGVTLGSKNRNAPRIAASSKQRLVPPEFKKAGIKYEAINQRNQLSLFDGRKLALSRSSNMVNINSRSAAKLRGMATEIPKDVSLRRTIKKTGDNVTISENLGEVKFVSLNISKKGNNALSFELRSEASLEAKSLIGKIDKASSYKKITDVLKESEAANTILRIENEGVTYVQLNKSKAWLRIESRKIEATPPNTIKFDFSRRIFDPVKQVENFKAEIVDGSEVMTKTARSEFVKYTKSFRSRGKADIVYTSKQPLAGKEFTVQEGSQTFNLTVEGRDIYLKNNAQNLDGVKDFSNQLSDNGSLYNHLTNNHSASREIAGFYNSANKITIVSPKGVRNLEQYTTMVKDLIPDPNNSSLKGVVFGNRLSMKSSGFMEVPQAGKITDADAALIKKLGRELAGDQSLPSILRQDRKLEAIDVNNLIAIGKEHPTLRKNYFKMKATEVPENMALVNFNIGKGPPINVIKTSNGMRIENWEISNQVFKEANLKIKAFSKGEGVSEAEFLEITKPIADRLETLGQQTGKNQLVTIEPEGLSLQKIHKLHYPESKLRIRKDQNDYAASIENIEEIIYPDLTKMKLLCTADLSDPSFNRINNEMKGLLATRIDTQMNLTYGQFQNILSDSTNQQLILIIRANRRGVFFADQFVSLYYFENMLLYGEHRKEMVYVISNEKDLMMNTLANYGNIKRVVGGEYVLGKEESLARNLEAAKTLIEEFTRQDIVLKKGKIKKLSKKFPVEYSMVKDVVIKERKAYRIELGKLTPYHLKRLQNANEFLTFLDQYKLEGSTQNIKDFPFKTIDNYLEGIQDQALKEPRRVKLGQSWSAIPESKYD